jgi:hypothetical protein
MSHRISSINSSLHQGFVAVNQPNHYNEDRIYTGTHVFAVIDGATSVIDFDMGGLNPSAYTSQYLYDFLSAHDNDSDDAVTTKDLLQSANESFQTHLREKWPQVLEFGKLGPSASVALIKIHKDNKISYSNIADCSIATLRNNQWSVMSTHSKRHAELDKQLADAIFDEIKKGLSVKDARQSEPIKKLRNHNRSLSNIEYGVFNGEEQMNHFLTGEMIDASSIQAVALLSDGLLWPEESEHHKACIKAVTLMENKGVYSYFQELKALYDSDPNFKSFRRLKHMDDSSGVLIRL